MLTQPLVSVVIPAYRAAGTIGRAVESVLEQAYARYEILVVDDGSPDDLSAAVAAYAHRIMLIRQPNQGAGRARNCGINQARGALLAFLDADDFWERGKLEIQVELFRRWPELGLAASRYSLRKPDGATPHVVSGLPPHLCDRVLWPSGSQLLEVTSHIWTSTVVVRRDFLGDRRFDEGLRTAEDRDLWIRLAASGAVYIGSVPLATYVLEPGSLSRSDPDADYPNMLSVVRRHRTLLGRSSRTKWEGRIYRAWAAAHLGNEQPERALAPAGYRILRQPVSLEAWWVFLRALVARIHLWWR